MSWTKADVKRAQIAIDGFALEINDRLASKNFRDVWPMFVTDGLLQRNLISHALAMAELNDGNAASSRPRAANALAMLVHREATGELRGVRLQNEHEYVARLEKYVKGYEAKARAYRRLANLARETLPFEVLSYVPLTRR